MNKHASNILKKLTSAKLREVAFWKLDILINKGGTATLSELSAGTYPSAIKGALFDLLDFQYVTRDGDTYSITEAGRQAHKDFKIQQDSSQLAAETEERRVKKGYAKLSKIVESWGSIEDFINWASQFGYSLNQKVVGDSLYYSPDGDFIILSLEKGNNTLAQFVQKGGFKLPSKAPTPNRPVKGDPWKLKDLNPRLMFKELNSGPLPVWKYHEMYGYPTDIYDHIARLVRNAQDYFNNISEYEYQWIDSEVTSIPDRNIYKDTKTKSLYPLEQVFIDSQG